MLNINVLTNNVILQTVTKGIQDLAHYIEIMADANILITVNMTIFKHEPTYLQISLSPRLIDLKK